MRPALILLPLILATACATPREACISGVNSELRVINSLIAETRGNLARGYALEERSDVRIVRDTCETRDRTGAVIERVRCDRTETFTTEVPKAIDLNAERAKLTSLEERQMQMQVNAQAGIAQCVAANPE